MDDFMGEDLAAMRIGIVGTGAVASGFARVLGGAPCDIYLWGRRSDRARELAQETGIQWADGLHQFGSLHAVILAVSDDAAGLVAGQVAEAVPRDARPAIFHTGGARTGARAMGAGAAARFELGSIHPLVAVPRVPVPGVHPFGGMPFAIESSGARSLALARSIVEALGGDVLELPKGSSPESVKLRYHALATMVATGVATLVDRAAAALAESPGEAQALRAAYGKLAQSAARNVSAQPGALALTGALARGDEALLAEHVEALRGDLNERLYAEILAAARGMLEDR